MLRKKATAKQASRGTSRDKTRNKNKNKANTQKEVSPISKVRVGKSIYNIPEPTVQQQLERLQTELRLLKSRGEIKSDHNVLFHAMNQSMARKVKDDSTLKGQIVLIKSKRSQVQIDQILLGSGLWPLAKSTLK